jgi:hypothetical protein
VFVFITKYHPRKSVICFAASLRHVLARAQKARYVRDHRLVFFGEKGLFAPTP